MILGELCNSAGVSPFLRRFLATHFFQPEAYAFIEAIVVVSRYFPPPQQCSETKLFAPTDTPRRTFCRYMRNSIIYLPQRNLDDIWLAGLCSLHSA